MEANCFIFNGQTFHKDDYVKITLKEEIPIKNIKINDQQTIKIGVNIQMFVGHFFVYESANNCLYFKDKSIKGMVVVHVDNLLSCNIYDIDIKTYV